MSTKIKLIAAIFLCLLFSKTNHAQSTAVWNGKVVLQGFWWDYWNNNYPNGWSNYLADLAPRLKQIGIDAVWIPPFYKNTSTSSVGYSPFDHYDLGDKYQKGSTLTRMGNKDELLRMIAVMHANGIEVIEDIVLNHMDGAGSSGGAGGQDPNAIDDGITSKYKNFRYTSYSSPATNESFNDYTSRKGRWSANASNFYPNQFNNHFNTNDIDMIAFGPDISYESSAYGQSSNALYNPVQGADYMRNNARNWLIWLKKQTNVDGFRFDASKHFPNYALQDFIYNAKYNAGWANGGQQMFAVGEFIGSAGQMDGWINSVQTSNSGTEDLVGTFDFSLRDAIKNMANGNGFYDLAQIPGQQQSNRYRTVPFVNNHDTYRPMLSSAGDIIGWNTGNEIGGHIDPFNPRISAAYAIACAVDGAPQLFFEDLFNVGGTGKRFSHLPTNTTDLPMNQDIANIIWCHQYLQFKKGSYKVRWQAQDLLVIERAYNNGPENSYAIIGVNDNLSAWQTATVQTDFGPNVQLHDYSGANANDIYTDNAGKATISVPPCDGSNLRKGYAIWGKANITNVPAQPVRSTTQEWEMSNDLGDSHINSLRQGGELPLNDTSMRYVGKVFSDAAKLITVEVFPTITNSSNLVEVQLRTNTDVVLQNAIGTINPLQLTYTPTNIGFYKIYVKNKSITNVNQTVYVKTNYTAPLIANTAAFPSNGGNPTSVNENKIAYKLEVYPNLINEQATILFETPIQESVTINLYSIDGKLIKTIYKGLTNGGTQTVSFNRETLKSGMYFINYTSANNNINRKIIIY